MLPLDIAHRPHAAGHRDRATAAAAEPRAPPGLPALLPERLARRTHPRLRRAERARTADGPIQNNDFIWPVAEGREGLEQTFNAQLTGKNGQLNMTFDATGKKTSEKIVIPPQPGCNVVTTLDEDVQRIVRGGLGQGRETRRHRAGGRRTRRRRRDGLDAFLQPERVRADDLRRRPTRRCRPTPSIPLLPARSAPPIRPAPPSRSRSASPRWRVARHLARTMNSPARRHDDRPHRLSQLEKSGRRHARFRRGAHAILRHLVLPGRHQDGRRSPSSTGR